VGLSRLCYEFFFFFGFWSMFLIYCVHSSILVCAICSIILNCDYLISYGRGCAFGIDSTVLFHLFIEVF